MNDLTYKDLLHDRLRFRQAGGYSSADENILDIPNHSFFRLVFHFYGDTRGDRDYMGQGLLHPSWIGQLDNNYETYWEHSSAYNYLKSNAEDTRAEYIKKFILTLSDINTLSPWYFQAVKGLEEAVARKQSEEFTFKEPYTVTIECLPDSLDTRIGTLLDLYRAAAWSWSHKKEILPSNLRKFDMSIYIVSSPIDKLHIVEKPSITQAMGMASSLFNVENKDYASFKEDTNGYKSSFKRYDLIGCEIDYGASKDGAAELNNEAGFETKYNIVLKVQDIYEHRYNEFIELDIKDIVKEDIIGFEDVAFDAGDEETTYNTDSTSHTSTYKYLERIGDKDATISDQLWGMGTQWTRKQINRVALGNLFGFSISRLASQLDKVSKLDIGATYGVIKEITNKQINKPRDYANGNLGNLFKESKLSSLKNS